MQKKTAASLATLALVAAIAVTGVAAATIATPDAADAGTTVRSGSASTVVQTSAATSDEDGWQGQLPDVDRFRDLSSADQQAVVMRVDRLIGDLRGTGDSAGLVAQLSGYRQQIERPQR